MQTIRCSALPMLFKCSQSQELEGLIQISSSSPAAESGNRIHDAIDCLLKGVKGPVLSEEERPIFQNFLDMWAYEKENHSAFRTEVEIEGTIGSEPTSLTGHIDFLSVNKETRRAIVIDWKTGRADELDYRMQLMGYCALVFATEDVDYIEASIVWLRTNKIEMYEVTRADVVSFLDRLKKAVEIGYYSTGQHCGWCQRSTQCEALQLESRRSVALFTSTSFSEKLEQATGQRLIEARRMVKMLANFGESLDAEIRRRISLDGPIESDDGYQLELAEENGRREVDALKAWTVLQDNLTDEELAGCVKVSLRAVEDTLAKKAGHGNGAAAKRKLSKVLDEAQAVTYSKVTKLKEKRINQILHSLRKKKELADVE